MSGFLLDTNVVLLALNEPERLSQPIRDALAQGPRLLSVATYWEVTVKCMKQKLGVTDPDGWWLRAQEQLRASTIGIRSEHVSQLLKLPAIHQDPFDRILIAQAMTGGLTLLTTDATIKRYQSDRLRVVG